MKKLLIIPLLILFASSYSQTIDTIKGLNGKIIYDTALSLPTNYLITPTRNSIVFDSTKVIVSAAKNITGDSTIFYDGGGNVIATLADRGSTSWQVINNDIYRSSGRVSVGNSQPLSKFNVESGNLGGSIGGTAPVTHAYDTSGIWLINRTPATSSLTQNSPAFTQTAQTWNTTGSHTDSLSFRWIVVPFSGAGQNGAYILQVAQGNGSYVNCFTISTNGNITSYASSTFSNITSNILAENTQLNANGPIYFQAGNNYYAGSLLVSSATQSFTFLSATGGINNGGGSKTWTGINFSPTIGTNATTVNWTAFQNNGGNNFFNTAGGSWGTYIGDTTSKTPNVIFRVKSTTQLSHPFPNMTATQRGAIPSPNVGDMVYQTDGTEGCYIYKSTGWTFAY